MLFDDLSIEIARKRGAPEPEENCRRAKGILDILHEGRVKDATAALDTITDNEIRETVRKIIDFSEHCYCMPPYHLPRKPPP
jgi:hypothetical protein